jgi:hypothetical protein
MRQLIMCLQDFAAVPSLTIGTVSAAEAAAVVREEENGIFVRQDQLSGINY